MPVVIKAMHRSCSHELQDVPTGATFSASGERSRWFPDTRPGRENRRGIRTIRGSSSRTGSPRRPPRRRARRGSIPGLSTRTRAATAPVTGGPTGAPRLRSQPSDIPTAWRDPPDPAGPSSGRARGAPRTGPSTTCRPRPRQEDGLLCPGGEAQPHVGGQDGKHARPAPASVARFRGARRRRSQHSTGEPLGFESKDRSGCAGPEIINTRSCGLRVIMGGPGCPARPRSRLPAHRRGADALLAFTEHGLNRGVHT
jgi:hypothetical protein